MTTAPTTTVTTGHLSVPGAQLYYEVRGTGSPLVLTAAPMDATSFETLADLLADDHLVVTTDPRGIRRSPVEDPGLDCTPEMRADDVSRLLAHLDSGPAAVLGSSGGAVSVLALAQRHPKLVHTVIAHEPPLNELVEDRDHMRAATESMITTYLSGDVRGAWVEFLNTANIQLPDEVLEMMIGGDRDPQDVADEHYQFAHMLRPTTRWQPDLAALHAVPTRIVVGIGEESTGQLCDRTSRALATALEIEPTLFPGDHLGFVDRPEAFAARLRAVLEEGRQ
jgi:pimeloyl-ACP methyl ester carboxylesterase